MNHLMIYIVSLHLIYIFQNILFMILQPQATPYYSDYVLIKILFL